jgi:hypothetical protein
MEIKFSKKGYNFIASIKIADNRIIEKITYGDITSDVSVFKHSKAGWGYEIKDRNFIRALGVQTNTVFIQHESAEKIYKEEKKLEDEIRRIEQKEKEDQIAAIKNGNKRIVAKWHDGEYLQGWEVGLTEGQLLEEIGVCRYVEGWGYHVDSELIEKASKEFTYQQALDFAKPRLEIKAETKRSEVEAEEKAKAEAKKTGKPVLLYRYISDCNDPELECSTDIIYVYAMPDGTCSQERVHTY